MPVSISVIQFQPGLNRRRSGGGWHFPSVVYSDVAILDYTKAGADLIYVLNVSRRTVTTAKFSTDEFWSSGAPDGGSLE